MMNTLYKVAKVIGLFVGLGSLGCASDPAQQQTAIPTSLIRYDTINFGSYYNIPQDSVFFLSLRDENQQEISSFQNDSVYKVEVFFKSSQKVDVKVVSLNPLIHIEESPTEENKYLFKVSKTTSDKGKSYAKLAIIPPTNTHYIFRNRFWVDSTHTAYQDVSIQMDTLCKLTFRIK